MTNVEKAKKFEAFMDELETKLREMSKEFYIPDELRMATGWYLDQILLPQTRTFGRTRTSN